MVLYLMQDSIKCPKLIRDWIELCLWGRAERVMQRKECLDFRFPEVGISLDYVP